MRRERFAIAVCSIAMTACGASTSRVMDPSNHAARTRMDTAGTSESGPAWNLAPLGTLGWETVPSEYRNRVIGVPIPAEYGSDDNDRWILGSFRARLRGDHVEWAPQLVAGGVVATTTVGGTELFVTRGGTLARSTDWLGPLERTGGANARMALEYASRVRTLTLDDDLQFWSGSGDEGIRRIPAPNGSTWIDLAFLSDRIGYGIAEPGRIYRSTDGGAHWTRFEPHTPIGPAFRVVRNLGVLRIDGLDGSFEIEEDGQDRAVSDRARHPMNREAATHVLRDWVTHHPLARPTLTALQLGFELQHHTLVTIYGETLYEIRPDGRDEISTAPNTTVREGEPGCRVAPLGGRIAAVCPRQDGISVSFERAPGDWQAGHQFEHDRALEVSTSVTPTMTFTGPCNDATAMDETFCWTDGSRWITRRRRSAAVVAHPGEHGALLHDESGRFPEWSWVSVEGADERAHELKFTPRDATVTYAETAPADGVTIVASHHGARLAGVGNPLGTVELRPLPAGARSARFASGMRGIAVGDSLRDVWLTEDGGASWRRAALPFEGDGHDVDLETDSRPDDVELRCWARGCAAGRALLWAEGIPAGIRAVGDLRGSFLGPQSLLAEDTHHPFDFRATCEYGTAATRPEPAPLAEHASARGFGADGSAQIVASGASTSTNGTRVVWRGVDARGAFESSTAVSSWAPPPFAAAHDVEQQLLFPRLAERDVLVAVRCDGSREQNGCDSVVYAHTGRPVVFVNMVQLLSLDHGDEGMPTLRGTLREPDGSVVIHIAFEDRLDIARDVVMRIDASDHVTTIGRTTWDVRRPQRILARWNGRVGLAVFRREDRERIEFHPFDGDPTVVTRAWGSGSHVRPCAPNESADQADTFELATNALGFRGQVVLPPAGHDVQGLPTIRLLGTPAGDVCLRDLAWAASFAVSAADEEQSPRWFRVHVGSDGVMRGPVITRDGLRDGLCRITAYE